MSDKMHIKMNVNGKEEEFLAEPRELLIYTLRETVSYTHLTLPTNREV